MRAIEPSWDGRCEGCGAWRGLYFICGKRGEDAANLCPPCTTQVIAGDYLSREGIEKVLREGENPADPAVWWDEAAPRLNGYTPNQLWDLGKKWDVYLFARYRPLWI